MRLWQRLLLEVNKNCTQVFSEKERSMATDDVSEHSAKCPCGKSTVTFITSSPDHPWARASQTSYSATIDCEECRANYAVHQESHNDRPAIVLRKDVESKKAAHDEYWAADAAIKQSEQAARLRPKIIAAINAVPSMAARHRKLTEFRLSHESYGTYCKRPYDGARAMQRALGVHLARIGSTTDLGGEDQQYFADALVELEKLSLAQRSISLKTIKLDGEPA